MFTPFVTDEQPVALYEGVGLHPTIFTLGKTSELVLLSLNQMVPPQYTSEGLAIDCALVLHVLKGTARIRCNFEIIEEQADSVVLFNSGNIIKVEQRSADFEVEILAFSSFIQLAALNQLENVNVSALRRNMILDTQETASAASGMVRVLRPAIDVCTVRELYFISVIQLRQVTQVRQLVSLPRKLSSGLLRW